MKIVITTQSLERLEEALKFYTEELHLPKEKIITIKNRLLERVRSLADHPYTGQFEPYLAELNKDHRRLIEGNFKIIYRIERNVVYITDFFDSRNNPDKMTR